MSFSPTSPRIFLDPDAPGCAFLDPGADGEGTPLVCLTVRDLDMLMAQLRAARAGLVRQVPIRNPDRNTLN